MSISILSFVPFPLPDESPTNAIQRTARANGFKNCRGLLSYLSKSTSQSAYGNCLLDNSAVLRALQACSPEHSERIKTNFYQSTHPLLKRASALVKGIEISYSNLRRKDFALCSECLTEAHERSPKDIKLFSNCPFHNRAYLFRCPSCNIKIKWKTRLTCYCDCGELLVSPKVSDPEMTQDQYLFRLFRQGNIEQIASIQHSLAILERETHTTNDAVKSARCALAIAINRRDLNSITNAIHNCLPCSSAEEIDVSLTIIDTELSKPLITALRRRLISTTFEQKDSVAEVTLSVAKLQDYIGISQNTWYKLKYRHDYFRGIGRGAKVSLKSATDLKKTLIFDKEFDRSLDQENIKHRNKQLFSISAVEYFTELPENTIKILALETNLLGLKKRHARQTEKGSELLFGRNSIDYFNQHYVCSHRMSREWNIPISTINNTIRAHHFQLKKLEFIKDTAIIKKRLSVRLSSIIKNHQPFPSQPKKRLDVPRIKPSDTTEYITALECARLLTITESDTRMMIRERIIPCHCKGSHNKYLISKQDALNFDEDHIRISELSKQLNVSPKKVYPLLSSVGILPISGPLVNNGKLHLYKKSSIPSATIKSLRLRKKPTASIQKKGSETRNESAEFCVNIHSVCEKYSISKSSFYHYFLSTSLIQHKKIKSDRYITTKDSVKIINIMEKCMPYKQAAAILNVSRDYIRGLVSTNRLTLDNSLFYPIKNPGLVSRDQIDKLRFTLS